MDLHLTKARATPEEQAAIDLELGPLPEINGGASAPSRDRLLPVLHAIQRTIGWISPGSVNCVAQRMNIAPAEIHGVASFYGMFSLQPRPPIVVHVCDDIACKLRGADHLCAQLEQKLGAAGSPFTVDKSQAIWMRSQCLGLCERSPAVLITQAGKAPKERALAPAKAEKVDLVIGYAAQDRLPSSLRDDNPQLSVPQSGWKQSRLRLLARIGKTRPGSLDDYRSLGGYEGLRKALELGPEGIIRELAASKLLGRGGAAFPTARKWEALHLQRDLLKKDSGRSHYIICNADESEPGTFKDRVLMEGDPFAIVEGMTIGALATGASKGYIYLRGEYPLAAEQMAQAIDACRKNGLLGKDILGRGLYFDIELRRGAGAYICGEETALFNSIEGYRGEPRNKPPFPTQAGLFRQPTAVNNVETLANVPLIIREGGAAFSAVGTANSSGTRLFCLCGHVARPGVYEAPMGVILRELIQMAGGMGGSGSMQAVLLGGAAGAFVSPKELDTPLTFEATRAIGATLGSGVVMVVDDTVDLRQILLRVAAFFRHETCGQCVPCRVGVVRQQEALERLIKGSVLGSKIDEINRLREMGQAMRDASICGLGQTASSAVESALQRWNLFA